MEVHVLYTFLHEINADTLGSRSSPFSAYIATPTSAKWEGLVSKFVLAAQISQPYQIAEQLICDLTLRVCVYLQNWHSGVATPMSQKQCVCDCIPAEQTSNRLDARLSRFALVGVAAPHVYGKIGEGLGTIIT